jgi:hypothetical protein
MSDIQLIICAEKFLKNNSISYVKPGTIGQRVSDQVEIIFLVPEALDPNIVIDPPDVRLWVDINSGKVEFMPQM